MDELEQLLEAYKTEYIEAQLYGSYSRTLKRKIPSKSQVQSSFIENITMLSNLSNDEAVKKRIEGILKSLA